MSQRRPLVDPVVAYRLRHWLFEKDYVVALTSDRIKAQQLIWELDGPWTTGDIDLLKVTRSELEQMRSEARA